VERTEWIYSFSSIFLTFGIGLGLLVATLFNNDEEERNETIEQSDEIIEGVCAFISLHYFFSFLFFNFLNFKVVYKEQPHQKQKFGRNQFLKI
jgi:hypothetical protein